MKPFFGRSILFNFCFYILTGISCVVLLPTLFMPREKFMAVVYYFCTVNMWLEKYILGLTYEIKGAEHLPKDGAYIIAAKHQSAYETFKLHFLFKDPAIILKKELLSIPLWGAYLKKSDVIAIDRSTPKEAIKSIQEGAKRMQAQKRPIIIFPQGTRVTPETTAKEKPYRIGVFRVQEATGLPIIPMALNTGVFYPKNAFFKKSGKVTFEFLPPIPANHENSAQDALRQIEMHVEEKTHELMNEGEKTIPPVAPRNVAITIVVSVLLLSYIVNWMAAAYVARGAITKSLLELQNHPAITKAYTPPPRVSGFPGKLTFTIDDAMIESRSGKITVDTITAKSWPFMGMPVDIAFTNIQATLAGWNEPMPFSELKAQIVDRGEVLTINKAYIKHANSAAHVNGTIDYGKVPYPELNLNIALQNHNDFITTLVKRRLVKENVATVAGLALNSLQRQGIVYSTLTSHENKVYLGPLKILELAPVNPQHTVNPH